MRNKPAWLAGAALVLALPAIAQQASPPATAPAAAQQPASTNSVVPAANEPSTTRRSDAPAGADESSLEVLENVTLEKPPPPVEYPDWARRNPSEVGSLNPADIGLPANPWGRASGAFLSTLLRRMQTPIASRWAHIALRDALLAKTPSPYGVNTVDWVAERAWLLLRLGEADAARLLVAGVDTDRFTPKMYQVAVQSALANGDPPALCPLESGLRKYEPRIRPLVAAMCSSLAGAPQVASSQIDDARRFGRLGGIDLSLAEKVVGAGTNTGRSTTIEWEPVDTLNSWRFGLAAATGLTPPARLMKGGSPQMRAFHARAALIEPAERLDSAFIAAGLGVFSSQSMVDLYSSIYDTTDANDLADSDAWRLRLAFVGKDRDAKLDAIRHFLKMGDDSWSKEGARTVVARAAALIAPDPDLEGDAAGLISAMLSAGYDRAAARWMGALGDMDRDNEDRCWAMLALSAPANVQVDTGSRRIASFIDGDKSKDKQRSALLVAGLAGLGRISQDTANSLNRSYGLGLGRTTNWTRTIDEAAARGQAGTVLVMTGTGMQTAVWDKVPAAQLYHSISALKRTGQDFTARMIAAEALSRT